MFTRIPPTKTPPPAAGPKPRLPMVQLAIYRVRHSALEQYLSQVFRMEDFDFCLAAGLKHGECPEYIVGNTLPMTHGIQAQARRIRSGRRSQNILLILTMLCADDYIPAGKYIIDTHEEVNAAEKYRALLQKTRNPLDPKCAEFRERHKSDRVFRERAAIMDRAVTEMVAETVK
jgi:hypothetical protein